MARKNIPLKDKELVKQRLAQGASTREAIKGTVITSNKTAANIARRELHEITQLRGKYLTLIRRFGAGEINRARLWAEMTKATKFYGKEALEYPDWQNRGEALRYIDSLAGLNPPETKIGSAVQVNITPILGPDIHAE